jgi:hypothetical protein
MKRACLLAGLVIALAVTACTSGGGGTFTVSRQGQMYRASSGWSIVVPRGWHVLRFSDSADGYASAGIQVSNLRLPRPTLITGYPQVSGLILPSRAASLIIAADTDAKLSHGHIAVPPLPYPKDWAIPSTVPGHPYLETLWFRADGHILLACGEIGSHAADGDINALAGIVRSLER